MKPTRNIVKPNTGLWNAKGKVWFQKNDDGDVSQGFYDWVTKENAKKGLTTVSKEEMGEMVGKMKGKIAKELSR